MELVYLWVEDYKNIQKQGFNFSPRFECKYENNELTIYDKKKNECKNNNYIENFFGNNINVTAIVGKNGSGKSRLLELLTDNDVNGSFFDKEKNRINIHDNFDIFLINENEKSYLYQNNLNVNKIISKRFNLEESTNDLKYQINNLTISFLSEIGNISSDIYFSPTGIKLIFEKEINLNTISSLRGQMIIYSNTFHDTTDREIISLEDLKKIKEIFEKKLNIFVDKKDFKSYLQLREFIFRISRKDNIVFKHLHFGQYDDADNIESVFELIYKKFLHDHDDKNFDRIIQILENINTEFFNRDEMIINYYNNNFSEIEILLVNLDRGYFNIEFFLKKEDQVIYFNNLSDGEQQILLLFSKIYYSLRTIFKDNDKDVILLIDEPDTFLHPSWQKNFLSYFHIFINNLKFLEQKKIQLIFTTHSPFLLSDIPKENIIFLDKDNKGNCTVGNGLNEKKQTFGANIHTLLSDSFFMEDGLMGEFAKAKIEDVINYLNDKKSNIKDNDEAQKLISIIGEPIIKNQLQKMIDSKMLSKIDKIDVIERQIKELQEQLKKVQE